MSNLGDRRLLEGPGDGVLLKTAYQDLYADLTALWASLNNRVTAYGNVAPATTAGRVRTTSTCDYLLGGNGYQKAATDNLFDLSTTTTGGTGYAKVLLQLDASGAASIKKGTEAASQSAAGFPAPDLNVTVVGWVQLGPSYTGGAIGTSSLFDGTPQMAGQLTTFTDQ